MAPPDAARQHYFEQRAIVDRTVRQARRIWATTNPARIDESWKSRRTVEQLFVTTSAGQTLAASGADTYLDRVLAQQGIPVDRTADVSPRAFAGVASDGRDLEALLYEPVITTKIAIAKGAARGDALAAGEAALARIVATQVQDAGRTADAAGIIARPAVTRWVRMLVPPSCGRCAVLAGKTFRFSEPFRRHPFCDCRHIPTNENIAGSITSSPSAYFRSLSETDQDKYFTKAGAETIRNGGDIAQVVNARRGMYSASGQLLTSEGATKRGIAGKRLGGQARLMPETILETARDRTEMLELLRQHGYLT